MLGATSFTLEGPRWTSKGEMRTSPQRAPNGQVKEPRHWFHKETSICLGGHWFHEGTSMCPREDIGSMREPRCVLEKTMVSSRNLDRS